MAIAYLTLLIALIISSVAIFYSVAGLAAIFAGAATAIVIMGTALEVAKLVAAVWLHRHWEEAPRALRGYLVFAVVVLMCITSMGIFGFLSKAHIEQAAEGNAKQAKLERLVGDVARQKAVVARAEERIEALRAQSRDGAGTVRARIDAVRDEIAEARDRAAERVERQREVVAASDRALEQRLAPRFDALEQVDAQIDKLDQVVQGLIDLEYLSRAQERQAEQKSERDRLAAERARILSEIEAIRSAPRPDVEAARERIAEVRRQEEDAVADLRAELETLRARLGGAGEAETAERIRELGARIREANATLDELTARKFELEAANREIEAKVGPIKYIAAFVYGEDAADENMLEEAVRWVIVVIIVVFDPLAVLLLIAAQWSFLRARAGGGAHGPPPASAAPPAEPAAAAATTSMAPARARSAAPEQPAPSARKNDLEPAAPVREPAAPAAEHADSPDAALKAELMDRLAAGKRKPSEKSKNAAEAELGQALRAFTDPMDVRFDKSFTAELRERAPRSWIAADNKK